MAKKTICLIIALINIGFSWTKEGLSTEVPNSYNFQTTSGKELVWNYGQSNQHQTGWTYPLNHQGTGQGRLYNILRKETLSEEMIIENKEHRHRLINVTANGKTCVLFRAKRIMIRFRNETQLDLATKDVSLHNTIDLARSSCNEENATLSLKFLNVGVLRGLALRFLLIKTYYKLFFQNWFQLHHVQIIFNNSVQATFNSTRISTPIGSSFHCHHISSLKKYDALLVPSSGDGSAKLWDITFLSFQIQAFDAEDGHFGSARDCTTYMSLAILMGLVMSLVLLLVLAYALHMLIHLKSIDKHYQRKHSTTYLPKTKDYSPEDEREPLSGRLQECYELRQQQQHSKRHMQPSTSVPY
uniref:Ac45-related protein n=1 Tax=Xenopus laevis TaxID=8355 RepID=A0A139ZDP2_XENLA|nr:Ac45-related protein [Xenopus laevis]